MFLLDFFKNISRIKLCAFLLKLSSCNLGEELRLERVTSYMIELGPIAHIAVQAGDRLTIETPGGGGWGRRMSNVEWRMSNVE